VAGKNRALENQAEERPGKTGCIQTKEFAISLAFEKINIHI
jgi:hypothetical protein